MSGEVIDTLAELLYNSSDSEFKLDLIRDDLISSGVQDLSQVFSHIATNGLTISLSDLENFLKNNNVFTSGNDAKMLFYKMDRNEDKNICFKEFQDAVFPKMDTIPAIQNSVIHRPYTKGIQGNPIQRGVQLLVQFFSQELKNLTHEENIRLRLHQNPYFEYEKTFELIDLDGKGFISEDDLYNFMNSLKANFSSRFSGKKNVVSAGSSYADELEVKVERVLRRFDVDLDSRIGIRDWTRAVCTFGELEKRGGTMDIPNIRRVVQPVSPHSQRISNTISKKISFDDTYNPQIIHQSTGPVQKINTGPIPPPQFQSGPLPPQPIQQSYGAPPPQGDINRTRTVVQRAPPSPGPIPRTQAMIQRVPTSPGTIPPQGSPPSIQQMQPTYSAPGFVPPSHPNETRPLSQVDITNKVYRKTGQYEEIIETNSPEFKVQKKTKLSPNTSLTRPIVEEEVTKFYPPKVKTSQVMTRMHSDIPLPSEGIVTTTTEIKETNPDFKHKKREIIVDKQYVHGMPAGQIPINTVTQNNGFRSSSEYISTEFQRTHEEKRRTENLPEIDYDSPSRYSEPKSPIFYPKPEKIDENTYISRRVTHDLSQLPHPQIVAPLTDATRKLLLTTLTEMIHDYRILEKARIDLSLRTDFNIR